MKQTTKDDLKITVIGLIFILSEWICENTAKFIVGA